MKACFNHDRLLKINKNQSAAETFRTAVRLFQQCTITLEQQHSNQTIRKSQVKTGITSNIDTASESIDNNDNNISFDENNDDSERIAPWRSLLAMPARAAWRVSDIPTTKVKEFGQNNNESDSITLRAARSLYDSSTGRTKTQLRKMNEQIMEKHRGLANRRDRERMRILLKGRTMGRHDLSGKNSQRKDEIASHPIVYGADETIQHIQYRLIPQYAIVRRVLQETKSLLAKSDDSSSEFIPKRILDFGIGCGSASAAALDVWSSDSTDSIEWIHGIDPSLTMRETSQFFLEEIIRLRKIKFDEEDSVNEENDDSVGRSSMTDDTRITVSSYLSSSLASSTSTETATSTAMMFDMAIMAYTASEFPQNTATIAAAAMLYEKLRPNGIFVMIEPGTPDGFSSIRTVRNMLLHCVNGKDINDNEDEDNDDDFFNPADYTTDDGENDNDDESKNDPNVLDSHKNAKMEVEKKEEEIEERFVEECHVIAPCTHNGPCPLERFHKLKLRTKKQKKRRDANSTVEVEKDDGTASMDVDVGGDTVDEDDKDDDGDDDDEDSVQGFCSFVQTMPGGSGPPGSNKGEKFTYLVVQKRIIDREAVDSVDAEAKQANDSDENITNFEEINVVDLLQRTASFHSSRVNNVIDLTHDFDTLLSTAIDLENRFLDSDSDELGLELLRGDTNRQSFGRIIRAPKKKRGHVLIDTCCAPGVITRQTIRKSMAATMPGIYSAARKSRWGGLWPNVQFDKK